MPWHYALPMRPAIQRRILRLRSDGCGIQQDFRAEKRHAAGAFRKPLVPADSGADPTMGRRPDSEAGIAGIEIELLLVAGAVGNVRFAVKTQFAAVGVDHG